MRRNLRLFIPLVISAVAYLPLNRRPRDRVLKIAADDAIPMFPPIAVPYLAFLPIWWLTIVVACLRNRNQTQLLVTATLVYTVSNLTYLTFQTHAPRPKRIPNLPGAGLIRYIYSHDRPYCDFPSEHASSAVMFALYYRSLRSPASGIANGFALSVVLATLLTKQHTIAGTLGGALLAPLAWVLVARVRGAQG